MYAAARAAFRPAQAVRIEPPRPWQGLELRELWRYRELLYFFVWRDIKVRYKQTVLGATWAVLQPLTTMATFTSPSSTGAMPT